MTADEAPANSLTIDELARRCGVTTRNVRAYQERGLLPPAERRGRTGYYGDHHVARLATIGELQERGYSLAAIGSLIATWEAGGTLSDVLGFGDALDHWSAEPEPPIELTFDELYARYPTEDPEAVLATIIERGWVVPLDDGRYRLPQPRLADLIARFVAAGFPTEALLEQAADLEDVAAAVADRFMAVFVEHIWHPFVEAGAPADELPGIVANMDLVGTLPSDAFQLLLRNAMDERMTALRAEIRELGGPAPAEGARSAGSPP